MPKADPSPLPAAVEAALGEALARHATTPGALLPIFHALQDRLGYVPPETLPRVAEALNLSRADLHGTLSFYHDFRTSPPGRHVVKVCRAEACQALGCERLIADACERLGVELGDTRPDGGVTLEAVYCLGNCALGPSALVDGRLHGRVSPQRLEALLPGARVRA